MAIARVRGVMAAAIAAISMLPVARSASTKTGLAPVSATAWAVAVWVMAGTMTSSPAPRPSANHTRCMPVVHDDTETACGAPVNAAKSASNWIDRGPWTRMGPDSTSRTAPRSSSPIIGIPKGMFLIAGGRPLWRESWSSLVATDFDGLADAGGFFDGKRDRHGVEHVGGADVGLAAVEDCGDERRHHVALVGAGIRIVDDLRLRGGSREV